MAPSRCHPTEFSVGWICALAIELAAAKQMLDEEYESTEGLRHVYVLGRVGPHKVVLGVLPSGRHGTTSAAVVTTQMKNQFPRVEVGLMVGIGGGVPGEVDVRLGDVVVSHPGKGHGGVIQYDLGKARSDGQFERTSFLNAPPNALLDVLTVIRARDYQRQGNLSKHLSQFNGIFTRDEAGPDHLYRADVKHTGGPTCDNCDTDAIIIRPPRDDQTPQVHYGTVASGNEVVKDGIHRDRRSAELGGVLCFEMEAAGLMNNLPCLVIRGVSDYADSHKNDTWQPYASATAAAFAKEVLLLLPPTRREAEMAQRQAPNSIFIVPFARDENFVSRSTVLGCIEMAHGSNAPARHQRTGLVGIGGIGKSQVAIEYAYQRREQDPETPVFWIHASNTTRFEQSYRHIAKMAALPGHENPQFDALQQVHDWLSDPSSGRWLMILDNVDDDVFFSTNRRENAAEGSPSASQRPLEAYVPQSPNGYIVITSRNSTLARNLVSNFGKIVHIDPMTEDEALGLLRTKISIDGFESEAKELARALDRVPLAISHAAAYMQNHDRIKIPEYLKLFQENEANQAWFLSYREDQNPRRDYSNRDPVLATLQITFDRIQRQSPRAADLLSLSSMFDRQGIPESLLNQIMGPLEFESAIASLKNFLLLREQAQGGTFEMHRLVQLSSRTWLNSRGATEKWVRESLRVMASAFPDGNFGTWDQCQILLPHSLEVLSRPPNDQAYTDVMDYGTLSINTGYYLNRMALFSHSQAILESAIAACKITMGLDHQLTLACTSSLGYIYAERDEFAEAEQLLSEVIVRSMDQMKAAGETKMVDVMKIATRVHQSRSRLTGARKRVLHVLHRGKSRKAPNPPAEEETRQVIYTVLDALDNLVNLYSKNQHREAEELALKLLETKRTTVHLTDESTANSAHSLAMVYFYQGRYAEAEKREREAIDLSNQYHGEHHPKSLFRLSWLAQIKAAQGEYEEATRLLKRCLPLQERLCGPENPDSQRSATLLAVIKRSIMVADLG